MTMERFHYEYRGKKIDLPRFDELPFGLVRRIRKEDETEQVFSILEEVCSAAQLKIVDGMNSREVGELVKAWQEDAQIAAGESDASSS